MVKKWYSGVAIIGDGTALNLYRPDLPIVVKSWVAEITSGADGRPTNTTCRVCCVCDTEADHAQIQGTEIAEVVGLDVETG